MSWVAWCAVFKPLPLHTSAGCTSERVLRHDRGGCGCGSDCGDGGGDGRERGWVVIMVNPHKCDAFASWYELLALAAVVLLLKAAAVALLLLLLLKAAAESRCCCYCRWCFCQPSRDLSKTSDHYSIVGMPHQAARAPGEVGDASVVKPNQLNYDTGVYLRTLQITRTPWAEFQNRFCSNHALTKNDGLGDVSRFCHTRRHLAPRFRSP